MSLAADGRSTSEPKLEASSTDPPSHNDAFVSGTAASTTTTVAMDTEESGVENGSKPEKEGEGSDFVSPELFEDPLPDKSAVAVSTGGVSISKGGGGAAREGEDQQHRQTTLATLDPRRPLKETIAQLVSQGNLSYRQASQFTVYIMHVISLEVRHCFSEATS